MANFVNYNKVWKNCTLLCYFCQKYIMLEPTFEQTLKSLKILTLMGSFWSKYIMFELKSYRGVMSHDTEEWSKEKLILEKYAFSLCCNRSEAVNGRYSKSVEKMFDNRLEWSLFLFLLSSIFWGYLNSQVSINKMGNSLDFHPCLSRLTPRIHHFM